MLLRLLCSDFIIILVTFGFILACGIVEIKSTPQEAEILVSLPGKIEPKTLGKTPYSEKIGQLTEFVNQGTIVLTVKKDGYFPQDFIVPNLSQGNLNLDVNLQPYVASDYHQINQIVSLSFKAERMIIEKRYKEAEEVIKKIKDINENTSIAYQLRGTILFLQKDYRESYHEWIRSLELEPENSEAQQMLALLEKKLSSADGKKP